MVVPTSKEKKLQPDDMIVSKTDTKGKIIYCNDAFMKYSGYFEEELMNQSHNLIRHPDMPRSVFRFMWNNLQKEDEFLGFVKNLRKDGGYYWVFANVFLNFDSNNNLLGYMSTRRYPHPEGVEFFQEIYRQMIDIESRYEGSREAMDASLNYLQEAVATKGGYNEFVCSYFK